MRDDELIAEFMGFVQKSYTKDSEKLWCQDGLPVGELKFKTSWDWLMPVVAKINDIVDDLPPRLFSEGGRRLDSLIVLVGIVHIVSAYRDVVDFIKWYNQNSAKEEKPL